MKLQIPMRKKLLFAIVGLIINWFVAYLRQRGVDVSPEEQSAIMDLAQQISGAIVGLFMIAQGIADHGKEAAKIAKESVKTLLILFLCTGLLSFGIPAYSQPEGPETIPVENCFPDLKACEELLDECTRPACPHILECQDCEKICEAKCGWVALVKDKTFMTAVLGAAIFVAGGLVGIFTQPPQ